MQHLDSHLDARDSPLGRRRFLGWMSAFFGGCVLSVQQARASWFYSSKPVVGIPKEWAKQGGSKVYQYANYIERLRLKNITPYMVLKPHFKTRGRRCNCLPPKSMWKNIAATLRVIDAMSTAMRAPVDELISIYRSPSYNRAVRGRSRSQHLENRAADVKFKGASAYRAARVARQLRARGKFKGGIGRYRSFTHIDTRGRNVDW